ncbi:MAG: hypothetical protein N4A48_02140 [Tepidibacter sp.]|uniref:hypothetical protein n=1 Tax=Tepidibacter sp. TaxID=2529387 RepID=UPI0025FECF96|nr:hypothetical protein [Tepidibacter sp.]MCT4507556.1 hypothetical protein [Tepidibacter sp.]
MSKKSFPIMSVCLELLMNSFSKSDQKAIQNYASQFPTHEDVDNTRGELDSEIQLVFKKFENAEHIHQLRTILKKQPTHIKFFIFEKIAITLDFLQSKEIECIFVNEETTYGQSFSEALKTHWRILVDTSEKQAFSLSDFSLSIVQNFGHSHQ